MRLPALLLASALLVSCSTLPRPGDPALATRPAASGDPAAILRESARQQGDPWKRASRVTAELDGQWSAIATRLQPVLTDPGFRKSSVETYLPPRRETLQIHRGPQGTKEVRRSPGKVRVTRNGGIDADPDSQAAAALVADAYVAFLFGSSWLAENARDLALLDSRRGDAENCHLVAGRLKPGFGLADEDHFIAWIDRRDATLRRLQFTLNGLESTRGADVDVVFSGHFRDSKGFLWPRRFVEDIQRPLRARAHEWDLVRVESARR